MSWGIVFIVVAVVIAFTFLNRKSHGLNLADGKYPFEVEKPDGYIYCASGLTVSGIFYRQQFVNSIFTSPGIKSFILTPEPTNLHDPNAIAITCGGGLVGYVDRETAAEIAGNGINVADLLFYPKSINVYRGNISFVDYALLKPGKRFSGEKSAPLEIEIQTIHTGN